MRRNPPSLSLLCLVIAISLNATGSPKVISSTSRRVTVPATSPHRRLSQATDKITKANWQQHPQIKAIRAIVQSVKAGMTGKTFSMKKRAFEYCQPYEDTARMIAKDSKGTVRFYQNAGGSEDSSLKWEHYYDEQGHLRFVFITGGAVNGSQLEHRIYFDETGKRIWEDQVYKKGPGYTFPEVWPDEQLHIRDAAVKFDSQSPCPEEKRPKKAGMFKRVHRN